jgi:hypothetical protein
MGNRSRVRPEHVRANMPLWAGILNRLGVHSQAQAAFYGREHGLTT